MAKLTEVQQEIDKMLKAGKTPDQIAQKRKVSTNAIYQQIRRIRAAQGKRGGAAAAAKGNSRTTKRASTASKPKAKARPKAKASSNTRRQSNVRAAAVPQTAEGLLTQEIATIDGGLDERNQRIAEAEAVIALTREEISTLETEKERKVDVLAVLTGEKVAHAKPTATPKRKTAAQAVKEKDAAEAKAKAEREAQEAAQAAQATSEPEPQPEAVDAPAEAQVEAVVDGEDAFYDPEAPPADAPAGETVPA